MFGQKHARMPDATDDFAAAEAVAVLDGTAASAAARVNTSEGNETLVRSEVSNIERSFGENERRVRSLIDELYRELQDEMLLD